MDGGLGSVEDAQSEVSSDDGLMKDGQSVLRSGGGRGILVCRVLMLDRARHRLVVELSTVVRGVRPASGQNVEASLTIWEWSAAILVEKRS